MAYTTINDPSEHYQTMTYCGNGSARSIVNDGNSDLQPDLVWIKGTSGGTNNIQDSSRGAGYVLVTDSDDDEFAWAQYIQTFNSDGFSIGGALSGINVSTETFVAWNWKAGTTGSGTTTGEGTGKAYSYTVSTEAGFSMVKYVGNGTTGHTIPHHLGVQPHILITKRITPSTYWGVWNVTDTAQDYMNFNDNINSSDGGVTHWNDTEPTSSVFSVGTHAYTNTNDNSYMAFLWTSVKGYSKFGTYTGTGSATLSPFVYLGFKPAWVMTKRADSTSSWDITDNKRGYNNSNPFLRANLNYAEDTDGEQSLLSNGFKPEATNADCNADGGIYIYAAWAESPLVNSNGVPCNAR